MKDVVQGPPGGMLVLVVDDDPVYRRLVVALLHENGFRSAEAAHAEGAWVLVRRLRPRLIVLDYALSCPEGALLRTGWDLAERMNSDERTRHIPFLFVTGFEAQLRERLRGAAFAQHPRHILKPVKAPALLESITATLGESAGRVLRVLLADDDPMVTAYVSKVLPAGQFHLEVVNDGEECLHVLRTRPESFDLLLLDVMMPGTSGYDVLREMALHGTAAALPVIVLTANPDVHNEEQRRLLEQGLVLEVVGKTEIHEPPRRLTEAIAVHLSSIAKRPASRHAPGIEADHSRSDGEDPAGSADQDRRAA